MLHNKWKLFEAQTIHNGEKMEKNTLLTKILKKQNAPALAVLAAGIMQASVAQAILFEGTATGSWTNVVSTDAGDVFSVNNNDAGGIATFNWGTPATSFDNQFSFDGSGSDGSSGWSTLNETAFLIGDFSYRNGSTYKSTGIDGVDLSIDLAITSPLGLLDTFAFDFSITNTSNTTGNPVLDGDIVTVTSSLSPTLFNYLGSDYTLELLGFSTDGGASITTDFSSPEGAIAAAGVYGRITQNAAVPEPSILAMMGIGLLGFMFRRKGH